MGKFITKHLRCMIQTYDKNHPWNNQKEDKNLGYKLIMFFIWPFGTWLLSLLYANKRSSYVIFFLFSLLLCWHMAPTGLTDYYDDFLGIMERFNDTFFTYQDITLQIDSYIAMDKTAPKELYENILIWFVKNFTDNYHFYFLLCAIPVAYCQLNSLKRITQDVRYKSASLYALLVIILFIFPRDIITVQNPRFTTGFWICLLCSLNYYCDNKKNILRLLPIAFTPLIHSGMWLYVIIVATFCLGPKNTRILEFAAICSLPFTFIDADIIKGIDLSVYLPENLYMWSLNHFDNTSNVMVKDTRAGYWWVGTSFDIIVKCIYIYMFIMMVRKKNDINNNTEAKNFYPFFLFLLTIVNLIQCIPVLGGRYYWFIKMFTMFIWFKAFYPKYKNVVICLLLANSWGFLQRYGYVLGGALATNTPTDIFYAPLPYLLGKGLFWE